MAERKWNITIDAPFAGFAPGYFLDTYPVVGNKNMAGKMQNIDISNPVGMTQGPGLAALTNGTQAGVVTTLIKHILNTPSEDSVTWGIGGNLLYKITPTTVVTDGNYPHTINKAVVTGEDGESTIHIGDYLYYFYNHSGDAGDIGRLTIATNTFDDDWGSTAAGGDPLALEDAPHPSVLAPNGIIYFGNGRYIGSYDPVADELDTKAFDFHENAQVVDIDFDNGMIVVGVNFPNLGGVNGNIGAIFYWDTVSTFYQDQPNPRIKGTIGSIYIKDGVVFVWYKKSNAQGLSFGVVEGNRVRLIRSYDGSVLPNFGQTTEDSGFIEWTSGNLVYRWGAEDESLGAVMSQYCAGTTNPGALAVPFDELMFASYAGSNYQLAKTSAYDVSCYWYTPMFNVAPSIVDEITIHYEPTATGAQLDLVLRYNRGGGSLTVGSITHAADGSQIVKVFKPKQRVEDFRLEMGWSNGSAANNFTVRRIEINGHVLERQ